MLIHQHFIENSRIVKKYVCAPVHTVILVRDLAWLNDWLINDSDNSDNKADDNDDDNSAFTVCNFHHYKL